MSGRVEFSCGGSIGVVTLDHPRRGNALTEPMMEQLADGLPALAEQGARTLVVRGRGSTFCAGYDLTRLPTVGTEASYALSTHPLMRALEALETFPGPTVAALDGPAIGGGCLLASTCDLRFATPEARWSIPASRLGMVYPERGVRRLVALVGLGRTLELLLLAEPVDAATALAWGLVNAVDPADVFEERLARRLDDLAHRAPLAVDGLHATVRQAVLPPLDEETRQALEALTGRALRSEDLQEGLAALTERRVPEFRGR